VSLRSVFLLGLNVNAGTPLVLAPQADTDPALGKDPQRNNNFDYDPKSQKLCPFAAHSRKTNPRGDIQLPITRNRIVRRGITFGPELTAAETKTRKTTVDRGLLFKCYQSNIANGFQFIQKCAQFLLVPSSSSRFC
jgi:deferrochelatase/peroxidase EfeB